MAAPSVLQVRTFEAPTALTTGLALTGTTGSWTSAITAGSTLILALGQRATGNRTYSVADNVDGAWTARPVLDDGAPNGRKLQLFYIEDHTGGTVTVTVTSSVNQVVDIAAIEIGPSTFEGDSSRTAGLSTDVTASGYPCSASSTELDTSADVFVLSAIVLASTGTLDDPGTAGWTTWGATATRSHYQYKTSNSALTDEQGWIKESGSNRDYISTVAAFIAAGGGGFQSAWASRSNTIIMGGIG